MQQIEQWKDIPNTNGSYQASNFGRIKSIARTVKNKNNSTKKLKEKIIKGNLNKNRGYWMPIS